MNQIERERLRKRLYLALEMLDDIVNMLDAPWDGELSADVKAALEEVRSVLVDTGDALGLWREEAASSKW
jgi:hypothetical protein